MTLAHHLAKRLATLDQEFKEHHVPIINLTNSEEALLTKQEALDNHDDDGSILTMEIQQLITTCTTNTVVLTILVPTRSP